MFVAIDDPIFTNGAFAAGVSSEHHRHYRGRNALAADSNIWNTSEAIPVDQPDWEDMFGGSVRIGIMAAKKTFKPAIAIWIMMVGIAALYYVVPASHPIFSAMIALQDWMGLLFPILGMGLSVGLLVEAVKVMVAPTKRWTKENTVNALFNFAVFGLMGFTHYHRYAFQEDFFGTGTSWQVVMPKVMFDQFIWTVLVANPYQSLAYLWKNKGFSWKKVTAEMRPIKSFWGTQMLPVLIANWAFWIPMASIIYCFPSALQLPLSILAVTSWVLLLAVLTSANRYEE